jgi:hypothetical protein
MSSRLPTPAHHPRPSRLPARTGDALLDEIEQRFRLLCTSSRAWNSSSPAWSPAADGDRMPQPRPRWMCSAGWRESHDERTNGIGHGLLTPTITR